MTTLSKSNCKVMQSKAGNLYITHPQFKTNLRLYAKIDDLQKDPEWRNRVALVEGEHGFYCRLTESAMSELDL